MRWTMVRRPAIRVGMIGKRAAVEVAADTHVIVAGDLSDVVHVVGHLGEGDGRRGTVRLRVVRLDPFQSPFLAGGDDDGLGGNAV